MSAPTGLHVVVHHEPRPGVPTVVLVHGSLDRGASFARVARRLPEFRVLSYDRRGYRHSRSMRPLGSLPVHVGDLLDVIGDGPAVVIGHSYGGDIAMGAAIAAPGAVVAVAAYEPPLSWMSWWPRRPRQPGEEDPARFAEGFYRRMVGDSSWERATVRARHEIEADGPALMAELMALRGGDAPFALEELSVPAVFGRGGESRAHHRKAAEELHQLVPGSLLFEIEGAAHGAHLTHPGAFADMVRVTVGAAASG